MNHRTEKTAGILKVLGDTNRLGIVMAIGKGSRSVTELINITGLSQTLVSFHLRALRNRSIVKTAREGPFIYYSLTEPCLVDILNELSEITITAGLKNAVPSKHISKEMAGKGGR